jgi:hypothetical protein
MGVGHRFDKRMWSLVGWFILGMAACQLSPPPSSTAPGKLILVSQTSATTHTQDPPSITTESSHQSLALESTSITTQAPIMAARSTTTTVFYEPAGCWQPPDDYTRVSINNHTLNTRTYAMLQQAALLYDGEIDVAGKAIIKGSYTNNHSDSLGTHLGGGAVDIAVTGPYSSNVLYTEIEPIIQALRAVGFAAWLREDDEMEPGLGIHIHAIAIGDIELSPAAQEQLIGRAGYLRGKDGLPITSGDPGLDLHGNPLICRWMLAAGYTDLRAPTFRSTPGVPWQERLRLAAQAYQAYFPEDAEEIARKLNFLDGRGESAKNMCGPLAAAILRDAGLLPSQTGPVQELISYWQARPSVNGRPWNLFPERDYEVFRFETPLAEFDFNAWPLQPADFVYTYAKDSGFEHMFIVTELDAGGRAYTVTNQYQSWGNKIWGDMLILRYLLYNPQVPGEGIIYNEWSDPHLGRTGYYGFEVMRKRGLEAGSLYAYTVRPGDTLPDLAVRFGTTPESIAQANPSLDLANLQVDQQITIPIPPYPLETAERVPGELP